MEPMALYNPVARFEFSKFRAILPYPTDVFFFEGPTLFAIQQPNPISLFFFSLISTYLQIRQQKSLPFSPPSTPLTRWLSNGCHQICLTLHRGWIRKSWSWSRTRRSTPRPKLRWQLPWNSIYKLRHNSLFLVSKKKRQTTLRTCFFWTVWISWDIYNLRMVEGLEVGGRERGIIDDLSFNIWAEEVRSIAFDHFPTCLLLELSCWKPKKAPPCQAAVEGVRTSAELFCH